MQRKLVKKHLTSFLCNDIIYLPSKLGYYIGGVRVNKEEILAKSRNEKNDEGLIDATNRGQRKGIVTFCLVFIFIVLFNLFTGQSNYAPMAMFFAFNAAEAYPKYKFTKNKAHLVTTIASSIACIAFLINLVIATLR